MDLKKKKRGNNGVCCCGFIYFDFLSPKILGVLVCVGKEEEDWVFVGKSWIAEEMGFRGEREEC